MVWFSILVISTVFLKIQSRMTLSGGVEAASLFLSVKSEARPWLWSWQNSRIRPIAPCVDDYACSVVGIALAECQIGYREKHFFGEFIWCMLPLAPLDRLFSKMASVRHSTAGAFSTPSTSKLYSLLTFANFICGDEFTVNSDHALLFPVLFGRSQRGNHPRPENRRKLWKFRRNYGYRCPECLETVGTPSNGIKTGSASDRPNYCRNCFS